MKRREHACLAVVSGDRLQLFVQKGERGYKAFSRVIDKIEKKGVLAWYGDVRNGEVETSGLVITHK